MRDNGLTTFTVTPDKKRYSLVEQAFLNHAKTINKSIADLDLEIWKTYSGNV
jgi:thermostable 8-oxoguanine DNA glycosylase